MSEKSPGSNNSRQISIRTFRTEDLDSLIDLFRNTIHHISIRDYSKEQVNAWAPDFVDKDRWTRILTDGICFIAEVDGELAGFTNLMKNGHIHFLFVSKNHQGMGIATLLMTRLEFEAIQLDYDLLSTDSSITARPLFEKMGFKVITPQRLEFNGVFFDNFKMEKNLK